MRSPTHVDREPSRSVGENPGSDPATGTASETWTPTSTPSSPEVGRRSTVGHWLVRLAAVALIVAVTTGVSVFERRGESESVTTGPGLLAFGPDISPSDVPVVAAPPLGLGSSPWIDTLDRAAVVEAYQDAYSRSTPGLDWTGDVDSCDPGDSSDELRRATLERIAYFRAMAGVPAVVGEDPEHSRLAQAAAVMMSAEGALTHHPDPDFACFTEDGKLAAANSNLYLGRTGPDAIDGYIEDPGQRNKDVGHRSTILHPPTKAMGIGHVAESEDRHAANVVWVFDDRVFDDDAGTREPTGFVAWPPRGHVPAALVYPRWSLAIDEADFSRAEVAMDVDGRSIPLDVVTRQTKEGEVPSSVIVWEPDPVDLAAIGASAAGTDQVVTVSVTGIGHPAAGADVQIRPQDVHYEVVIIDTPGPAPSSLSRLLTPIARAALATPVGS